MAKYRVETNQGTFEVESDREPTQADVEAYLAAQSAPASSAPPPPPTTPTQPPGGIRAFFNQPGIAGNPYSQMPPMNPMAVADMGAEAGGATAGQMLGAATGPFAPVAVPVLGGLGGAGGNALAQFRQMKMGERPSFSVGEFAGAGVASMVPGGQLTGAPLRAVAREGSKAALANLAGKASENLIEGKPLMTGKEAATAGLGAVLGTTIARGLDAGKNPLAIASALEQAQDAGRRYTQKMGHELGYVFPPSMIRPNYANDVINSFGGSASMMREVIHRNQKTTNNLIRQDIGLAPDAKLMRDPNTGEVPALNSIRMGPNAVYKEVAAVNDQADAALKLFQDANSQAARLRAQYRDTFPKNNELRLARDAAEASRKEAEGLLKDELAKAGKPELWGKFQEARTKLAKIGMAQDAMNDATGDFDAAHFGRMWEDNPKLLTGKMEQVGRFWNAFEKTAKDANTQLPVAVNQLNVMAAAISGDPKIAATLTGLPRFARELALSKPYQSRLEYFAGPNRMDTPAMLSRFAGMSAGRQESQQRPVPYRNQRVAKAVAPAPVVEEVVVPDPPKEEPPKEEPKKKTAFKEGKIYRDPETGERRRYVKGEFVPV